MGSGHSVVEPQQPNWVAAWIADDSAAVSFSGDHAIVSAQHAAAHAQRFKDFQSQQTSLQQSTASSSKRSSSKTLGQQPTAEQCVPLLLGQPHTTAQPGPLLSSTLGSFPNSCSIAQALQAVQARRSKHKESVAVTPQCVGSFASSPASSPELERSTLSQQQQFAAMRPAIINVSGLHPVMVQ